MDDPAFSTDSVDLTTQTILLHASTHNLSALKPLLRTPGSASVRDPETHLTPLHAALTSLTPTSPDSDFSAAEEVVRELFLSGAIWNDLDANNETPGCVAWRLGERGRGLYEVCVNAGVRAEVLLGLMGGYEELGSEGYGEEDDEDEDGIEVDEAQKGGEGQNGMNGTHELAVGPAEEAELEKEKRDVNSEDYLQSELKFEDGKLLDGDDNGVMMAWETDIMRQTVDLLIPELKPGARVLNIGFGMGIVDGMFRDTKPKSHHIIEAHPAVLAKLREENSCFAQSWQSSAPSGGKYVVHPGKWQDICPKLLEEGEIFDAIYFDTFGEDYAQLKYFFTEIVPGLLDGEGRFGFFNGLGADRRICYDVYTKVAELDLGEAGMEVEWTDVEVPVEGMEKEGEGEWEGVRRRYWTLDKYRLPICTFLG